MRRSRGIRAYPALVVALLCSLPLLLAPAALRAAEPASNAPPSLEPRLQPLFKACGKKWAKRARSLSREQREWMLQQHHAFYHVKLSGRLVMTLEVLSAPSFRDCDVRSRWHERETSIRATYFEADGSQRVVLSNFAHDRVFFNDTPRFFPHMGKALLKGVTVEGGPSNRWVELAPLKELYADAQRDAEDPTLLAARLSPN